MNKGLFRLFSLLVLCAMVGGYVTCADEEISGVVVINSAYVGALGTVAYLIEADDGYIAIDTGLGLNVVEQALLEKEISPLDVQYVFLTHSDYDHVDALPLFVNAQVFMSEDEMQMVDKTTERGGFSFNSLPNDINLNEISLLHDGQLLNVGGHTIECIKLPGHTPGSMAYALDGQYLFTGDALGVTDNTMDVPPDTMDAKTAINSITKLRDLKNKYELVLTGHFGIYNPRDLKYDTKIRLGILN